jgi:hypothetical protein
MPAFLVTVEVATGAALDVFGASSVFRQGAFHQFFHSIADEFREVTHGAGGVTVVRQHSIHRGGQISQRVNESAIEVED